MAIQIQIGFSAFKALTRAVKKKNLYIVKLKIIKINKNYTFGRAYTLRAFSGWVY